MNSILRASVRDELGLIEIREAQDGGISLSFGNQTEQSAWNPEYPEHLAFSYYRALLAALILHPKPERLHLFGLGGGALARFLLEYSMLEVHTHDCRPVLAELARDHFGLDLEHPRLHLHFADLTAADWQMPGETAPADLMLLDLFDEQGMIPLPDATLERMSEHLAQDGLLCVNVWRNAMRDTAQLHKQLIQQFHRHALVMHVPHRMNTVMCYRRAPWRREDLQAAQTRLKLMHPDVRHAVAEAWTWMAPLPPSA